MSAEVESMAYVSNEENRFFVPWHGLGKPVNHAMTSEEALKEAGLDWEVKLYQEKNLVTGDDMDWFQVLRTSDYAPLGIVQSRYVPVQNKDAFAFTDALIGDGVTYETAGSLFGGKKIWMLAKLPETYILGDKFDPYLCFTNQHDGKGSVLACISPIRVVCNNTLNMAIQGATRRWSVRHTGDINGKLDEARKALGLADDYLINLAKTAEKLASEKMSNEEVMQAINVLFPIDDDATDRKKNGVKEEQEALYTMYIDPNIANFLGTKWGFINAVADYVDHREPQRNTNTFAERRFDSVVTGTTLLDKAFELIK